MECRTVRTLHGPKGSREHSVLGYIACLDHCAATAETPFKYSALGPPIFNPETNVSAAYWSSFSAAELAR
jgi:hypothetical protein